jgi:RHS repeat-associated protein
MVSNATNDAPAITLPTGGGALRGIGETFAPDLQTGTGNFTVPIALPPGRNGFQPQLNLVYSTGNGNGPFGLGWNLSIPGVSRKTAKGVPRYNEAEPSAALGRDYERRDVFLLSGAEDLVPVAGSYPGRVRYRPRTEGLFALIEHHSDPTRHLNHWEVHSKDGLSSIYGTPGSTGDESGTVIDPYAPDHVFAWRLTRTEDPYGNCITYSYRRNNAQVYLDCLRYIDIPDKTAGIRFLVSVAFEYDHEDAERPDAFSDFRSGFEIRSALRCRAITVRTHADIERLVRRYEFVYGNDTANGVSLLRSVTVTGYGDDGTEESLPPLEFGYTGFEPETRRFSAVTGPDLPAASLANPDFETVDLFGAGLPDILQLNGVARYWRNLGDATFDRPHSLARAPAGLRLADPGVQLLDADGDARADLLVTTGSEAGYFPTRFGATWDRRSFVRYAQAPSFNLEDPEVRLVDLDGDGISDALRSGTRFECFFNDPDPRKAWRRTRRVERRGLDEFPNVTFSDPRVKWADMSGDGLQDIVLVHDRSVEYWPNLGHGSWGGRRRMGNSPELPWGYDPGRLLLGDVDGDGVADLLYVDDRQVTLWINQSGNRWSDKKVICGTPPVTDVTSLRLLDLGGNGIAGLLWSRDADGIHPNLHFLDFTGGVKPYLLNRMVNNLGAETAVEYRTSTQEYLRDQRREETQWKTPLPFPVHVVARVEAIDRISRAKLISEYRYHHGYWDGFEREFRGFGRVDQRDTQLFDEDFHAAALHPGFEPTTVPAFCPPVETRTWFHQGPVEAESGDWGESYLTGEYWPDDRDFGGDFWTDDPPRLQRPADTTALLRSLPSRGRRDALRSLRGSILRTELYALDGSERERRPYTVTDSVHGVCEVVEDGAQAKLVCTGAATPAAGGADSPRVFFPQLRATRTTQWERGEDPLTTVAYTDGYDGFGRPRDRTAIALPRRAANRRPLEAAIVGAVAVDETHVLATITRTAYAAPDATAYPDLYLHDRVAHVASFEFVQPPEVSETHPQDLACVLRDQGCAAQQVREAFRAALDSWTVGDPIPSALRLIGHTRTRYDGPPFAGREDGKVGPHGAATRSEALVFTAAELDAGYGQRRPAYLGGPTVLPAGAPAGFGADLGYHLRSAKPGFCCAGWYADIHRQQTDGRGLVVATQDPLGGLTRQTDVVFDTFNLLPIKVTNPAGLETTAIYDYRVLQPQRVTDPNRNASVFCYSPLGLLHKAWLEGRNGEGGSEAYPETRHEYALRAYEATRDTTSPQPIFAHATRRIYHASDGVSDDTIESRGYSDGFGRLIQQRAQAKEVVFGGSGDDVGLLVQGADGARRPVPGHTSGPASGSLAADRVVTSGWQVHDNKGRVVERYEPFFAKGWAYQPELEAKQGRHLTMTYDPRGHLVRTIHPDSSEQRVILGVPRALGKRDVTKPEPFDPTPWESYNYDANDLDGLRPAPSGSPTGRPAPLGHRFTPASQVVDALGRVICRVERNGPSPGLDWFLTRFSYDGRGNLLSVTDPLGRTAFRHTYDLGNRALAVEIIDAGVRTSVPDALGNLVEYRDSKGSIVLRQYDRLARLVRLWARDQPGQALTLRERIEQGDGGDPAQPAADRTANRALNRLGRPAAHRDEAGLLSFERYDFTGNLLEKVRYVINDAAIERGFVAHWSAAIADADLDQTDYRTTTRYDALGRAVEVTCPREAKPRNPGSPPPPPRAVTTARYNRAGALESISLDGVEYVSHIAYNARSQRVLISYGNGLMTRYAYDPDTFRLARMRTERFTHSTGSCTWTGQGAALQDWTYAYDPAGNVASLEEHTPGCGVAGPGGDRDSLVREFTYDPLYRLTSATGRACRSAASRPLDDIAVCGSGQYGPPYRPGPPSPNQDNAPDHTEPYTETYSYDAADNLLKLTYQPQPAGPKPAPWSREFGLGGKAPADWRDAPNNRLTQLHVGSEPPHTYAFDDNGNLRQQNLERFHTWDHADRMTGYRVQHGSTPSVDARYLYAADGTRVKKWMRHNTSIVPDSTVYIDGIFEFHQWREAGRTMQQNHLHVMDNQSRVAIVRFGDPSKHDAGPPVQYHHGDHLGNSALVVRDDGGWINREEYTPYGEASFGSYSKKRYRYTGKERDEESGFYYHGARYYAPAMVRWVSPDPAGAIDSVNVYAYVHCNPVAQVDPTGMAKEDPETAGTAKEASASGGGTKRELMGNADYGEKVTNREDLGQNVQGDHPVQVQLRQRQRTAPDGTQYYNRDISKKIDPVIGREKVVLLETGKGKMHTELGKAQARITAAVEAGSITHESDLMAATELAYMDAAKKTAAPPVNMRALKYSLLSNQLKLNVSTTETKAEFTRHIPEAERIIEEPHIAEIATPKPTIKLGWGTPEFALGVLQVLQIAIVVYQVKGYLDEERYFSAALTALALVPFLGEFSAAVQAGTTGYLASVQCVMFQMKGLYAYTNGGGGGASVMTPFGSYTSNEQISLP